MAIHFPVGRHSNLSRKILILVMHVAYAEKEHRCYKGADSLRVVGEDIIFLISKS